MKPANRSPNDYDGQGITLAPDGYGGFENIDTSLYAMKRDLILDVKRRDVSYRNYFVRMG